MSKVDERADEALAHNFSEFMEKGPGLRHSTRTAAIAKCPRGVHVLRTGLGAMGVGTMWVGALPDDLSDPLFAELPVERCEASVGGTLCEPKA